MQSCGRPGQRGWGDKVLFFSVPTWFLRRFLLLVRYEERGVNGAYRFGVEGCMFFVDS